MEIQELTPESIALDDRSFDLGFARSYQALRRSVAEVGIVQPVVARRRSSRGPVQIVCGFGRVRVARELGLASLATRLLGEGATDADCLRLALFDNLGHRAFNPIERAVILARLEPHVGRERLIADYMPLLGMQPSGVRLDRATGLVTLEDCLKFAVAEGRLEETVGVLLSRLSPDDQRAFARLLNRCRPSVSVARELAEMLSDIARRDNQSVAEILAAPDLAEIIDSETIPPGERIRRLRDRLRRLRYPTLSKRLEEFATAREALHLPPSMRLEPSPAFESDELRLEIRFRSPAELRQSGKVLNRWLDEPSLLERLWPSGGLP